MPPIGTTECPSCAAPIPHADSLPFGKAVCPRCGSKALFLTIRKQVVYFAQADAPLVRRLFATLGDQQPIPPELDLDAFDVMELVNDFEAELDRAAGSTT